MIDGYDIQVHDTPERGGFALEVLDIGPLGSSCSRVMVSSSRWRQKVTGWLSKRMSIWTVPIDSKSCFGRTMGNMDLLVEALLTAQMSLNSFGFGFRLQTAPERKR
jgi:hypothetical protein